MLEHGLRSLVLGRSDEDEGLIQRLRLDNWRLREQRKQEYRERRIVAAILRGDRGRGRLERFDDVCR